MFNLQFKKSIIEMHDNFKDNNYSNEHFIKMIDRCFSIKKTTFYNWQHDDVVINTNIIYENINKLITLPVETYIVNYVNENKNISVKLIKKKIKQMFKITVNTKSISYILYKNNIKHKNIKSINVDNDNKKYKKYKKSQNIFLVLTDEHRNFIINNKNNNIKDIIKLFFDKFNLNIKQKQIVDVIHKTKSNIKSFFKLSSTIVDFIIKTLKENITITVKNIKEHISKEFNLCISLQLIYNILKQNGYVYKKFKINNNPYSIEEQVKQFEKINEIHNEKNIDNCISIDEISFCLNSKPKRGWFKSGEINELHLSNKNIINERYSLLFASSNEKILLCHLCKKGVKTDMFINFMAALKTLNPDNKKYYLLDNARVHKTKKLKEYLENNPMKLIYNAPYHSETNPIENIFSMLRNYLNRNPNKTKENLIESITNFINIDNKTKFQNIFTHGCKMITEFITKNKK